MLRRLLNRLRRRGGPGSSVQTGGPGTSELTADGLIAEGHRAEAAGRHDVACERYRAAIAAAPRHARAHLNLGIGLEARGDMAGATAALEAALAIDAAEPFAHYNLGRLLLARGLLAQAEAHLRSALERRPEFPEALFVLSSVLDAKGESAAAAATLEAVLQLRADDFGAWYHYGLLLKKLGRSGEAETALRRALAIDPANADVNYQLAVLLQQRGELPEAERCLQRALEREPSMEAARAALFHVFQAQGNLPAALTELQAALTRRPDWVDARYNYGLVLKGMRRLSDAETAFRRVLAMDPQYVPAHRMLGVTLLGQARIDEALQAYAAARALHAEDFALHSAELFALNFSDDITVDELFARHRAFGVRLETAQPLRRSPFRNLRDPARRLRIGYVSGDFCYHVVALFMLPLLQRHDRSAYQVFGYSTGQRVDQYTRQLAALTDLWRPAAALSEAELAQTIEHDEIDVLVDLSGHSGISQLGLFARQPAPVQVSWLGYLNTTGMTRIQYRLCDRHTDPPGIAERHHTEQLVRLPDSQWCYRPFLAEDCAEDAPLRRNGYVTFGSFSQPAKLSRSIRRLWADILRQVPDSRLMVVGVSEDRARDALLQDMLAAGVAAARVTVLPYLALTEYLRCFHSVDLALDTSPYSGGTTTCDTLWMGVPVLTVPGTRPPSRSAASILASVGLPEWIAATPEDYVRLAVNFAGDGALLSRLRQTLRARMRASPLMDEQRFARNLEAAYRHMWRAWCATQA